MNAKQYTPLTSFLSAPNPGPSSPSPPSPMNPIGAILPSEVRDAISPGADNCGHLRTSPETDSGAISAGADISRQFRTSVSAATTPALPPSDEKATASSYEGDAAPDDATNAETERPPRFQRSDEIMAIAIANGANLCEAARAAGVCDKTAQRRWKEAEFRDWILELRAEIRCRGVGRLVQNMDAAITALFAGLSANSEAVRISAARAILRLGRDLGGQAEENAMLASAIEKLKQGLAEAMGRKER